MLRFKLSKKNNIMLRFKTRKYILKGNNVVGDFGLSIIKDDLNEEQNDDKYNVKTEKGARSLFKMRI